MVIEAAELSWPNGLPYSNQFGDIYFSLDDGLAEKNYVFLQANQLAERFSKLSANASFTIAETGFGTGLNFLSTWQLWQQTRPHSGAWLHFVSLEKHPLTPDDLQRALALWPSLAALSAQLLANYPPLTAGWHRLVFAEANITLTLLLGDANELLPELVADVDAWFLDGFSPDKNPELWQLNLLSQVAKLSKVNTTLSTYSAAGVVKKTLEAAGFEVIKQKGFGHKRHMTTATLRLKSPPPLSWQSHATISHDKTAIVIGAGIAGVSCARTLALRGWQVTVIEQADHAASAASGNPAAIIYPKLAPAHLSAWHFQQQAYLSLLPQLRDKTLAGIWQERGLLWLLAGNQQREGDKLDSHPWPASLVRKVDAEEASAIAGVSIDVPCLYFPQAGFLHPKALCDAWLNHSNIQCHWQTRVTQLVNHQGAWQALTDDNTVIAQASVVVIANALAAQQLTVSQALPLTPVRGQIAQITTNESLKPLTSVLCYGGYLTPHYSDTHCLGASFLPNNTNTDITDEDHQHNHQLLDSFLPDLTQQLPPISTWQGRAALRAQTTDYLPMVGALPVYDDFCQRYAEFKHGKQVDEAPVYHQGLYVSLGHGSKGFCYAPLAAEIIAAELNHEPYPVAERVLNALNPARFWVKALKRRQTVFKSKVG
jgi:tRNA 5-methylaminomethyl-2-thiouridine biosynthesis bifunctional protein